MQRRSVLPKLNLLNLPILLLLGFYIVYSIIKYPVLAANEGWGMVYMVGLTGITATGLIVDLVIHNIIRSERWQLYLRLAALGFYLFVFVSFFTN
jgi:hypothetical protein